MTAAASAASFIEHLTSEKSNPSVIGGDGGGSLSVGIGAVSAPSRAPMTSISCSLEVFPHELPLAGPSSQKGFKSVSSPNALGGASANGPLHRPVEDFHVQLSSQVSGLSSGSSSCFSAGTSIGFATNHQQ